MLAPISGARVLSTPAQNLSCVKMNDLKLGLIRAPGTLTRICDTVAPPDSYGYECYLREHDHNKGNKITDCERQGAKYAIPICLL